jgi:hypothetical protein
MVAPFFKEAGFMRLIFSALMVLAMTPQVQAAVTLHVSSTQQDRTSQIDVTLADSYLSVDTAKGRLVYDFAARRRYAINTATKEYAEYSLFDTVGFRVVEMHNRDVLRGAVAAIKVDTVLTTKQVQENELSVFSAGPGVAEEKTEGEQRVFYVDGVKLAAWSAAGVKVSATDAAQFTRFMRYARGGHPQLLERLAKGGVIPENLTLFLNEGRDIKLVFTQVQNTKSPAYDLKSYQREISKDGVDALFDRIAAATPQQLDALRAEHPCDASEDFSDAQILDTMLGKMECMLSTGRQVTLTTEQKQAAATSSSLSLLFAAINPGKDGQMADGVKTLVALRQQAPRKAYVLKVFEANNRLRLKQAKEAKGLFIEALQANPMLGGAYKDLGDLLLMQYDSARAWRSWDAGRRVSPALPNFEAVNKFEADLLAKNPQFF